MLTSFKSTFYKFFMRGLKTTERSMVTHTVDAASKSSSLDMQPSVGSAIAMVNMNKVKSLEEIFPNYKQIDNFKETVKRWKYVAEKDRELWNLRIDDLKINLAHINDKKVIDYINKVLQKEKFCYSDFEDIELLTDSINSFNGIYSPYIGSGSSRYPKLKSSIAKLSEFHNKQNEKYSLGEIMFGDCAKVPRYVECKKRNIGFHADLVTENKVYGLKNYLKQHPNTEMSEHLYNNYYLTLLSVKKVNPEIISELKSINEKYKVKVTLGLGVEDRIVKNALNTIKEELNEWIIASNDQAKRPPVIDFNSANHYWYNNSSAYGTSAMFDYSEDYYNGAIACSLMDNANLKRSLRHELTHTNELSHLSIIKKKYNLDEIMPKKIVNGVEVIDFDNCKYKEELLNAGIESYRVKYAHNNTSEFIAIASEGDMSKYSKELKQTLIDFGMPEWMFKMKSL